MQTADVNGISFLFFNMVKGPHYLEARVREAFNLAVDRETLVTKVDPRVLLGLGFSVFALGPAIAHVIAASLIWRFPLDEAAHAEIRDALATQSAT